MYDGWADGPNGLMRGDDGADDGREAEVRLSKPAGRYLDLSADDGLPYDGGPCMNNEVCDDVRRNGLVSNNADPSGWLGIDSTSVMTGGPGRADSVRAGSASSLAWERRSDLSSSAESTRSGPSALE